MAMFPVVTSDRTSSADFITAACSSIWQSLGGKLVSIIQACSVLKCALACKINWSNVCSLFLVSSPLQVTLTQKAVIKEK